MARASLDITWNEMSGGPTRANLSKVFGRVVRPDGVITTLPAESSIAVGQCRDASGQRDNKCT